MNEAVLLLDRFGERQFDLDFTIVDTDLLFPMRIGRPLKLLADPIQRLFTFRPQRYNLWVALRPNAA